MESRTAGKHACDTMLKLYSLEDALVQQMQEASLDPNHRGLAPAPLVGSDEWLRAVEVGELRSRSDTGVIKRPIWSSMGDYPTVELEASDGSVSSWTREGDIRRYAPGLELEISYVLHPWEEPEHSPGDDHSRIVTLVRIEDSPLRVGAIGPGPGGAGFQLARQDGEVVHYAIGEEDSLSRLTQAHAGVHMSRTGEWWTTRLWYRDTDDLAAQINEVRTRALETGATYDGGEVVDGRVWGPDEVPA